MLVQLYCTDKLFLQSFSGERDGRIASGACGSVCVSVYSCMWSDV